MRNLLKTMPIKTASILRSGKEGVVHFVNTGIFLREVPFPVRVVVVKIASKPLILVCSSETISAEDFIHLYAVRFSIETAIEQMKGSLEWCDYQCYTDIAFHRFVVHPNNEYLKTVFWFYLTPEHGIIKESTEKTLIALLVPPRIMKIGKGCVGFFWYLRWRCPLNNSRLGVF